jgi:transposase
MTLIESSLVCAGEQTMATLPSEALGVAGERKVLSLLLGAGAPSEKRHVARLKVGSASLICAKGRKRQVMVDTDGRGLILEPQPADVQDRDGAPFVLRLSRRSFPFIAKAFADMGFAGEGPATATSMIIIEIVRKPADQIGFAVHPRRWVVERFFAWISRNRRLWKDPEATLASARAFLYAASVMLLTRRLARLS